MGRARRSDQACHDPPRPSSKVDDVAGFTARGIMRPRDKIRDLLHDPTGLLRLGVPPVARCPQGSETAHG